MKLIVVLYCRKENTWKLTDFGISAEGASTMISTALSRGTGGYRAPELLKEDPKFGRSVDVWALGCVLYEIAVGKSAFRGDWDVFNYSRNSDPPPLVDFGTEFYRHHLNEVLRELFSRDSKQRPRAESMFSIFLSYYRGLPVVSPENESRICLKKRLPSSHRNASRNTTV
jgi:serine/threonine protein kinase